jgi:PIN domain nuclease of toxin-antitoxin system
VRVLLDTHALLWWLGDSDRLSRRAYAAIADTTGEVFVSVVSAFEIATKFQLGKLPEAFDLVQDLGGWLAGQGFLPLPLELKAALRAGLLPGPQRDPFDRLLIAQAMVHDLVLVSNEAVFDAYGVRRLW